MNKIFDSSIRIFMLAQLTKSELTYKELRKHLGCADGAMTNHTNKLKDAGFINVRKEIINNMPRTTYSITELGRNEFFKFVDLLNSSYERK